MSQASDRDQYGNYLSELNSGNTYFSQGSGEYKAGMNAFDDGSNFDAMNAMSSASEYYGLAAEHYGQMEGYAAGQDQKGYASALKSYADSCKYAALAYVDAYEAYDGGDRLNGEGLMSQAAAYVTQANEFHDRAVKLQSTAIV